MPDIVCIHKTNYFFQLLCFSIIIKIFMCNTCKSNNNINNNDCFNSIIIFNNKTYRAGEFAENINGDIVIEYSDNSPGKSRLFYGLKQNGKNFFANENSIKTIDTIDNDNGIYQRYESKNIFISLEDDTNKENQYLLSTSTYETLTELYDFQIDNYTVRKASDFIGHTIFSFEYILFGVKQDNKNIYFCIYTHGNGGDGYNFTIKKFGFTSFSLSSYDNITSLTITNNGNNRIISSFVIEEDERFVVFFNKDDFKYALNFYDYNLNTYGVNITITDPITNTVGGSGIFFKSAYLGNQIGSLIYFLNGNDGKSLNLKILKFNKGNPYTFNYKIEKNIDNYSFQTSITLNDFLKFDNNRLVFISTIDYTKLYILVFDLYNDYSNMKIRVYNYDLSDYKADKEFSAFIYNKNYLAFTSTVVSPTFYSIFMMFGYPNGTDNIIDISPYFMDIENYDLNNNFINKLLEGLTINNNIFGYIIINQIKLLNIPSEILFYNGDDIEPLTNGDILTPNYRFNQNNESTKTDEYYSLDYQYIIKEPDYTTFYDNANEVINFPDNINNQSANFNSKIFYGRTNTAKFKLCHKYCASCIKLGISNDNQQCMSCLPQYQYDYFNEYPSNCVPEGYFNDKEENKLIECTSSNSKYYIDLTNNKRICFNITYDCPPEYPYWNKTTNECTIQTTIITISTTILKAIPASIITNIPTTITVSMCTYDYLLKSECSSFLSYNNNEIYTKIKAEIIETYPEDGESVVILGQENYAFQLTTVENEIDSLNGNYENKYNLSMIDLGECEKLIKKEKNIDEDENLIIFKFEKLTNKASEKNVQYEIYDPNTLEQLDLSICESTSIDLYIPISLSEKTQNLYNDLKESGYDLFNENDSFYIDR